MILFYNKMTEFNDLDFVYEQIEGDAKDVGSIL
jgi:hypothetical protein